MQAGQNSTCQIEGAITTASVHIAIFSRGYAESQWCLDELWLMLKSKATVIPVFFHVKPSDLRIRSSGTDGVYAEALRIHANEGRYNPQTIENWITALLEVSSLSGFELETFNGLELELPLFLLA